MKLEEKAQEVGDVIDTGMIFEADQLAISNLRQG